MQFNVIHTYTKRERRNHNLDKILRNTSENVKKLIIVSESQACLKRVKQ